MIIGHVRRKQKKPLMMEFESKSACSLAFFLEWVVQFFSSLRSFLSAMMIDQQLDSNFPFFEG